MKKAFIILFTIFPCAYAGEFDFSEELKVYCPCDNPETKVRKEESLGEDWMEILGIEPPPVELPQNIIL